MVLVVVLEVLGACWRAEWTATRDDARGRLGQGEGGILHIRGFAPCFRERGGEEGIDDLGLGLDLGGLGFGGLWEACCWCCFFFPMTAGRGVVGFGFG